MYCLETFDKGKFMPLMHKIPYTSKIIFLFYGFVLFPFVITIFAILARSLMPIGLHILTVWKEERIVITMYKSDEWKTVEICSPMGCTKIKLFYFLKVFFRF